MKFTLEELLNVIENSPEKKTRKKRRVGETKSEYSHINRFIAELNITEGTTRVPTYIIYYYYRVKWTNCTPQSKIKYNMFFRCFKQKFKRVRSGIQRYYMLNGSIFDLTREGKLEARHYAKTYKRKSEGLKKRFNKTQTPKEESPFEN